MSFCHDCFSVVQFIFSTLGKGYDIHPTAEAYHHTGRWRAGLSVPSEGRGGPAAGPAHWAALWRDEHDSQSGHCLFSAEPGTPHLPGHSHHQQVLGWASLDSTCVLFFVVRIINKCLLTCTGLAWLSGWRTPALWKTFSPAEGLNRSRGQSWSEY